MGNHDVTVSPNHHQLGRDYYCDESRSSPSESARNSVAASCADPKLSVPVCTTGLQVLHFELYFSLINDHHRRYGWAA